MSQLYDQVKKLKFDKRLMNSYLKKGEITQAEYDKHMQSLEDCADRAKTVKVTQNSGSDNVN
jgi:hypothetical protein